MAPFRSIGVGIDFSKHSERALRHATQLARRVAARLTLIHVAPHASMAAEPGARLAELSADVDPSIPADHVVACGRVPQTLVDTAVDRDVDLLVVGTHGRTGVGRFLLGSVAEAVPRLSRRPTLVVRGQPPSVAGYHKILVPTDLSETASEPLALAVSLAAPGGVIRVLHCWDVPFLAIVTEPTSDGGRRIRELTVREVENAGAALVERHAGADVELSFTHREASPRDGIIDTLDNTPFEVTIMGASGRSGVKRWLLGSVAETTIRHASCSVLVDASSGDDRDNATK